MLGGSREHALGPQWSERGGGSVALKVTVAVAGKNQLWIMILGDFPGSPSNNRVCFLVSFHKHLIDKTSPGNYVVCS